MQMITIKEITPSTAENKPTIIVDDTGAKMSGFDFTLKDLNPGDVIEAELQIKGKYTNILNFNMLKKNTEPIKPKEEMTTDMWAEKDRITRASIEGQVAMKCYTELVVAKIDNIPDLLLDALTAKIKGFMRESNGNLQELKKEAPHAGGKEEETVPHNIQAFYNYLAKKGKEYTPSWFKSSFGFTDADLQTEEGIAKALNAVKNVEW
ncbi:hypothetical protein LCGC14_1578040 [marine sediment metagenome]|uniref:Uncharacterized protein n=1 Tax=marine sediment metagenome TaxID=412755 RepID=A0A0F9J3U3_9ZZZZ